MLTAEEIASRRALLKDLRYDVEFDLSAGRDRAFTRTTMRFGCNTPGRASFADLAIPAPVGIALNGRALPVSAYADGRVALADLEDDNVLTVEAELAYAISQPVGLCAFDEGDERFVYTKASSARREMPRLLCCFLGGGPAKFELRVVAPAGWSVVSHAAPVEHPPPGSAGTWAFRPEHQMFAEALTFAAGPWSTTDTGEGTRAPRLHARPSMSEALANSAIGDYLARVLGYYERILSVPYPFDGCHGVFIPGYGAQAGSTGGIWMFNETVLQLSLDETWRAYVLWVVAHEAAHAWFGNLVFDGGGTADRWIAEGVATYLCHRAMNELAPELHPWARFHVLEEGPAHDADSGPSAHPVAADGGQSTLIYSKPAAVLRHLEARVGVDALDAGLTRFLNRYAFSDATTDDLVGSLQESAGFDLVSWTDDWLATSGVNTLELHTTVDAAGIVRKCHVRQSADPGGRLRTHRIGASAYDRAAAGLALRGRVDLTVAGPETELPELAGRPPPDLVVLNAPAVTYAKVRLDPRSLDTLSTELSALDPDTRAVCWVAASEMVRDGLVPEAYLRQLLDAHGAIERDPQVRDQLGKIAPPVR